MSGTILLLWSLNGAGKRSHRFVITAILIGSLVICWSLILAFGVFHAAGSWGMGLGFLISLFALFVPVVHKGIARRDTQ